jgi:hypothetical protein
VVSVPDFGYYTTDALGIPAHLVCPEWAVWLYGDAVEELYEQGALVGVTDHGEPYQAQHCADCGVMILPPLCRVCRGVCRCIDPADDDIGQWSLCQCGHQGGGPDA